MDTASLASTHEEDLCMEPLRLAGRIILENGGETYRVEETITRMGKQGFGLKQVECFAVRSGVILSFQRSDGQSETSVLRVRQKGTDLGKVDAVNQVSRDTAAGKLTRREVLERLREIDSASSALKPWALIPAIGAISASFTVMLGGSAADFLISFGIAVAARLICRLIPTISTFRDAPAMLNSAFVTLFALFFCHYSGIGQQDVIISGALMPLLPGLAMTSAVQDAMRGDMLSGAGHGLQALTTAIVIAIGTYLATALFRIVTGGAA